LEDLGVDGRMIGHISTNINGMGYEYVKLIYVAQDGIKGGLL
jgi:hypothetical protein